MNTFKIAICVVCLSYSHSCRADEVVLTVTLHNATGAPLSGWPVAIVSDVAVVGGMTDPVGSIERPVQVNAGESSIHVLPLSYSWAPRPEGVQGRERLDLVQQLRGQYAVERVVIVPLVPGQTNYGKLIVAAPAIAVSGKCVDASGAPLEHVVSATTSESTISNSFGTTMLAGMPLGATIRTFTYFDDGRMLERIGGPFAEPGDLGTTVVSQATDAKIHVTFEAAPVTGGKKRDRLAQGITIISADGAYIKTVEYETENAVRSACVGDESSQSIICVPHGQYWILPGLFDATAPFVAVLDKIKASLPLGQAAARVLAAQGQTAEVTIDHQKLIEGWKALGVD